MARYIYDIRRGLLLLVALLAMASGSPTYGQQISPRQSAFDEFLARALRMSDIEMSTLSPRMNHLWMATLVDSLQPSALSELGKTNIYLGRKNEGLKQMETAFRTSGYDYYLGQTLLQMAGRTQEWTLAEKVTDTLLKQRPDDAFLLQMLSAVYEESGQMDRAISTMKKLLEIKNNDPQYVFLLANLLLKTNKPKEAESLLLKYQDGHPDELMSSAMLISLWLNQKKYAEATELLNRIKVRFPDNKDLVSMSISTYAQQGMNDKVAAEILRAAQLEGAEPEEIEELIRIASQDSNNLTQLLKDLIPVREQLVKIFDETPQVELAYANHQFLLRDTIAGEKILDKMVKEGVKVPSPYAYFIQKYGSVEDSKGVQKYTEAGLKALPEEGIFNFYYSLIAAINQNKKEYHKRVNKALEVVSKDDAMYSQIAGMKAEMENEAGNWEEAKKYFEIAIESNDPLQLNNYAYSLTTHGTSPEDFKLAEQLAQRALKASPEDANIMDTYAWTLYKNKAYSMARIYIEKAIVKAIEEKMESMAAFYEHHADILTALGEYEAALTAWKNAAQHGTDAKKVAAGVKAVNEMIKNNPSKE